MKKYLKEHIIFIENSLKKWNTKTNWNDLSNFNKRCLDFLQHERLIHLLITLFFWLLFFWFFVLLIFLNTTSWYLNFGILIINIILLIMLCFYIWHYFVLENGIQKLYKLDKKIVNHYQNK